MSTRTERVLAGGRPHDVIDQRLAVGASASTVWTCATYRGPLADRPAHSLRGPGADMPHRKHARDTRLQRQRPRRVLVRPGAHEALGVQRE